MKRLCTSHGSLTLFLAALLLAGCYGVTSQHYFAIADLDSPTRELTFYRAKVSARSFLTKSEYSAGFYDANALRQLYGEVKNPNPPPPPPPDGAKKGNGDANKGNGAAKGSGSAGTATTSGMRAPGSVTTSSSPLAGTLQLECDSHRRCKVVGGANDRFTLIYGANADAVAQQIQSFAENEATGKQLAALLASSTSADAFERTVAADQNTEQAKKAAAALAKELKALADKLGEDSVTKAAKGDAARRVLLQAAQDAIKRAGASTTIDKTDVETGLTQSKAAYEVLSK